MDKYRRYRFEHAQQTELIIGERLAKNFAFDENVNNAFSSDRYQVTNFIQEIRVRLTVLEKLALEKVIGHDVESLGSAKPINFEPADVPKQ